MSHKAMLTMLTDAVERHWLRPLDLAFAQFLSERDPQADSRLLLLAALTSRLLGDGHPCLDLNALEALAAEHTWPSHWLDLLADISLSESPLLARSDGMPANAPLVLDRHRLYLRRYWRYECDVAQEILARLSSRPVDEERLQTELQHLFPTLRASHIEWPRVACALSLRGGFSVMTGGPGTGKTTTVVRLLGLLQTLQWRQQAAPLRIRLAAPTGKAAARLNASIARQIAQLDVDESVRKAIPQQVETLHRLLGARPDSRRYTHDRRRPLHLDVLVIDEASMIDLEMMAAVLEALPSHAQLILLGDKDQLSSVEAGSVLGDLCRRAETGHYTPAVADWLRKISGDDIEAFVRNDAQALDQHIAMLRHSHRFGATSGIGRLAAAVNAGHIEEVHALLASRSGDIAWLSTDAERTPLATIAMDGDTDRFDLDASGATPQGFRFYLQRLRELRPGSSEDVVAHQAWAHNVLEAFNHFQLLCAVRQGPAGTERLNREIASSLHAAGWTESDRGWYEGRPVMMIRNDYSLGLMNGDVGITLRMPGSDGVVRLYVAFPVTRAPQATSGQEESAHVRCVLPSRLGDVETVYAMTVHKSQGSEFEHTALVLPEEESLILTRELLYTGITRARRWLTLVGTPGSIEQALAQRTRRYSGLTERLLHQP
ncbi:exodeoxyribonuclease V subunit alpha [Dyella caseinilytica]|uniref:RecBCD enzyme subunit RecD n=1 Tax=Dyella caseinilytica TaxID=1849581 RepID=A0ABX7GP74_9GAMM|nr:exodeoxyribonuclease V subunit alpha [Dyella caseinilytica]QRN52219.1 exodeoxyribonuclease V subunit alpha [Dyella caseinilytica]GGA14166.1 RecBCD enzyme subunit RecD [Dyella caseinilytica]